MFSVEHLKTIRKDFNQQKQKMTLKSGKTSGQRDAMNRHHIVTRVQFCATRDERSEIGDQKFSPTWEEQLRPSRARRDKWLKDWETLLTRREYSQSVGTIHKKKASTRNLRKTSESGNSEKSECIRVYLSLCWYDVSCLSITIKFAVLLKWKSLLQFRLWKLLFRTLRCHFGIRLLLFFFFENWSLNPNSWDNRRPQKVAMWTFAWSLVYLENNLFSFLFCPTVKLESFRASSIRCPLLLSYAGKFYRLRHRNNFLHEPNVVVDSWTSKMHACCVLGFLLNSLLFASIFRTSASVFLSLGKYFHLWWNFQLFFHCWCRSMWEVHRAACGGGHWWRGFPLEVAAAQDWNLQLPSQFSEGQGSCCPFCAAGQGLTSLHQEVERLACLFCGPAFIASLLDRRPLPSIGDVPEMEIITHVVSSLCLDEHQCKINWIIIWNILSNCLENPSSVIEETSSINLQMDGNLLTTHSLLSCG